MTEYGKTSGYERESSSRSEQGESPQEIERNIGETRQAIGEDLRALTERLSPEHLREGAREVAKEAMGAVVGQAREAKDRAFHALSERAHQFGDQAKRAGSATAGVVGRNAVPLTLIGVGVTWLTLAMRREHGAEGEAWSEERGSYRQLPPAGSFREGFEQKTGEAKSTAERLYESGRERVEDIKESVTGSAREMPESTKEKAYAIQSRARDMAGQARARLQRGTERTRTFAAENPLAVAAAVLAAGIGIGLLLPVTSKESQLLGSAGERIQGKAREAFESGKNAVRQIAESARETASEAKDALRS